MLGVRSIVFPIALAAIGQGAQSPTSKELFDSLVKQYTVAEGKWTERYRSDDTPAAREESLLRYRDWPAWAFLPRFMELAEKNPKDAAAVDCALVDCRSRAGDRIER